MPTSEKLVQHELQAEYCNLYCNFCSRNWKLSEPKWNL